mmetsp:Transcript_119968/g.344843  ORF Transcript_119968/g.344843 Transcript_119968/m.344843 type:complete len:362 (+) Transcript_119968:683-1768(+)
MPLGVELVVVADVCQGLQPCPAHGLVHGLQDLAIPVHLLSVRGDEGREGGPRHKARPPRLANVRHIVACDSRRPDGGRGRNRIRRVDLEGSGQRKGLRKVHLAAAVVAVAIAKDATVALAVKLVLGGDAVQVIPGVEFDAFVLLAGPVEHADLLRLLGIQRVVHGDAPRHPGGIGTEAPPAGARRRAVALLGTDIRRVLPRHAFAGQVLVGLARGFDADPVRDGAGLARRVIQDVVSRGDRCLKRINQILKRRLGAVEMRWEVLVKLGLPLGFKEVPEGPVIGGREIGRHSTPVGDALLAHEFSGRWRQTTPLRAGLCDVDAGPIGQRPEHVRKAKIRGSECNHTADGHVDEVGRVFERLR